MFTKRRSAVFLFTALIAVSIPLLAAKVDIPTVNGFPGLFYTDADLRQITPVATGTPLPTQARGALSASTQHFTASPVPASLTVGVDAVDFTIVNLGTETVWLSFEGTATVSQGIPVYSGAQQTRDAAAGFEIWYVASTSTAITYTEGRR